MATTIRAPTLLDMVLLVLMGFLLASTFLAIKLSVAETGTFWLAAFRVLLGFLVVLPYGLWRGMIWPSGTGQWALVFVLSAFSMTIPFLLIGWAQKTLEVGVLSLLIGTAPFLALVGSHFLSSDDRMTRRKLAAVLFGFAGILLVVGPSAADGLGNSPFAAQIAGLAAAACYVVSGLTVRHIRLPMGRLAALALGLGALTLVPIAVVAEGLPPVSLSPASLWAVLYLGIFPGGIAYLLRFHLIRTIGYTRFSMAINMVPVFGVLLGVAVLGEPLSAGVLAALALVLTGLLISAREGNRPLPKLEG